MGKGNLIKLVVLSIAVGLIGRIVVILGAPLSEILTAEIDPVHTPGYYLLVRAFMIISDHLVFLRETTLLFFCLNLFLLYRLSKKATGPEFAAIWQVRMYTLTVSFILASQLLHLRAEKELSIRPLRLLVISLVDALGLYFSYSYVSQPLFHVRSMQIIGLTIVLLIAYMVYLMHKKSIVLCFLSLCAQLLVLVFASYQILY